MVYSIVDKLLWVEEISCFHMIIVNIRGTWNNFFQLRAFDRSLLYLLQTEC